MIIFHLKGLGLSLCFCYSLQLLPQKVDRIAKCWRDTPPILCRKFTEDALERGGVGTAGTTVVDGAGSSLDGGDTIGVGTNASLFDADPGNDIAGGAGTLVFSTVFSLTSSRFTAASKGGLSPGKGIFII